MRSPGYLPRTSELTVGNSMLYHYAPVINELAWFRRCLLVAGIRLSRGFDLIRLGPSDCSRVGVLDPGDDRLAPAAGKHHLHVPAFSVAGARIVKWYLAVLIAASVAGATCISTTNDHWSVGGQMLLNVGWYLFPFTGPAIWTIGQRLGLNRLLSRTAWMTTAMVLVFAGFAWQMTRPPSDLAKRRR